MRKQETLTSQWFSDGPPWRPVEPQGPGWSIRKLRFTPTTVNQQLNLFNKKCLLYYFMYRSQQKVSWPWKSWACFRFVSLVRSQAVAPREPGKVTPRDNWVSFFLIGPCANMQPICKWPTGTSETLFSAGDLKYWHIQSVLRNSQLSKSVYVHGGFHVCTY